MAFDTQLGLARGAVGTLSPCFHSAFSLRLDRRSSSPIFDDVSARPRPEDRRSSWTAPCCSSRRRAAVELKARSALATLGRRGAGRQIRLTDFNYIRRYLARAHALYTPHARAGRHHSAHRAVELTAGGMLLILHLHLLDVMALPLTLTDSIDDASGLTAQILDRRTLGSWPRRSSRATSASATSTRPSLTARGRLRRRRGLHLVVRRRAAGAQPAFARAAAARAALRAVRPGARQWWLMP